MTQHHLDRAVARATGESVATIRRLGFGLAVPVIVSRQRPQTARSQPAAPRKEPRRATT